MTDDWLTLLSSCLNCELEHRPATFLASVLHLQTLIAVHIIIKHTYANFSFPFNAQYRVRTDIKTLFFSRTFQDLQRPNSRVFQDSKNSFSRTFQDTLQIAENEMAASLCKHSKGQRIFNNSIKVFLKSELTQEVTKCT